MTGSSVMRKSWCIVIADDHGPENVSAMTGAAMPGPVQYCGWGEPATLLQRALLRAKQIAPIGQILVTVREEHRERWEPALWYIRPEHRFVSNGRMMGPLATAAALSAIAADSISNVVTVLPPASWVARHLKQQGAMVASGILSGPIHLFVKHEFKYRPGLGKALTRVLRVSANGECLVSAPRLYDLPRSLLRPLPWWPPAFPQRAIRVYRCGFRGLKSPRAVMRITASCPPMTEAVPQQMAEPAVRLMAKADFATDHEV
jgi:hypothetical protein